MSQETFDEEPPEALAPESKREANAGTTTELPVVVLGEADFERSAPHQRLLLGRINERWILYPVYALEWLAGLIAVQFALAHTEWSLVPIAMTWGILFVWNWFYGVAYRYRRLVLKYASVFVILSMSLAVAYFCLERAAAQTAIGPDGLGGRAEAPALIWSAVLTVVAALLVLFHVMYLGRGYRQKREVSTRA